MKSIDLLESLADSLARWRYAKAHPDNWGRRDYGQGFTAGMCVALEVQLSLGLRQCSRRTRQQVGATIRGVLEQERVKAARKEAA